MEIIMLGNPTLGTSLDKLKDRMLSFDLSLTINP